VLGVKAVSFTKWPALNDDIETVSNLSAQDDTVIVTNGSAMSLEEVRVYLALYVL
jgi:hypothetical protein